MSPGQRKSPRRPLLNEDIPLGGSRGVQWGGGLRRDSIGIEEEEEEEKEGEKNEEETGGLLDDADLKMVHVEVSGLRNIIRLTGRNKNKRIIECWLIVDNFYFCFNILMNLKVFG